MKKIINGVFALAIVILLFNIIYNLRVNNSPKIEKFAKYEVCMGDSIWTIAEKYQVKGWDIRNTIIEIQDQNKLKDNVIRPGQVLEVPIYKRGD